MLDFFSSIFNSVDVHLEITTAKFAIVAASIVAAQLYFRKGRPLTGTFFVTLGLTEGFWAVHWMFTYIGLKGDAAYLESVAPIYLPPITFIGVLCLLIDLYKVFENYKPTNSMINGVVSVALIWAISIGMTSVIKSHPDELLSIVRLAKASVGIDVDKEGFH